MEVQSGAPSTKRARLGPPVTLSSGGLAVAARSGEGAPPDFEDQEKEFAPDHISDLSNVVLGEVISSLSPLKRASTLKSSHVSGTLYGTPLL